MRLFSKRTACCFSRNPSACSGMSQGRHAGQILLWNMHIPTLPMTALGVEHAQLRVEFGLNCEFSNGSQHQLNTAHTDLWTAKNVYFRREYDPQLLRVIPASLAKNRGEKEVMMRLQGLFWASIKSKQMWSLGRSKSLL